MRERETKKKINKNEKKEKREKKEYIITTKGRRAQTMKSN